MAETKKKTLYYRRVVWKDNQSRSLEALMKQAHAQLSTTAERTFVYNEVQIQGVYEESRQTGFCCHVASCVPRQATALVPHPSTETSLDISVQNPPASADFMVGDIFFVIKSNHVILCPSGIRESSAVVYIQEMLSKAGNDELAHLFSLTPVANINKVNLLRNEGVRKISLNSTLYEATLDYSQRQTFKKKMFFDVAQDLKALFVTDPDNTLHEIGDAENLSVKVEISFDSRKKGGDVGKKRIAGVGRKIIEDNDGRGFTIETMSGKTLTSDEVRLSKEVNLQSVANSVSREAAFNSLGGYLDQLGNTGMLEQ